MSASLVALLLLPHAVRLEGADWTMLIGAGFCAMMLVLTLKTSFEAPVSRQALLRLDQFAQREENLSPLERIVARPTETQQQQQRRRRARSADLLPTVSKLIQKQRGGMLGNLSADLSRIGSNWRASEILYVGALAAAFMFLIVCVLMQRWVFGLVLTGVAFMMPMWVVRFVAKRWMRTFESQLADTLLLMSNATQAGYGFQQAMEMVAREGMPPMATEFLKMNQEVQLGVPIGEAMNHMCERVRNSDLDLAVVAIQISMEVGGAISEILRTISETIRERVRIRGEIQTLTAQGKLTGALLSALPIGMFFLLNVVTSATGGEPYSQPLTQWDKYTWAPYMVWYAVFSQIFGYMLIMRILNIEV